MEYYKINVQLIELSQPALVNEPGAFGGPEGLGPLGGYQVVEIIRSQSGIF